MIDSLKIQTTRQLEDRVLRKLKGQHMHNTYHQRERDYSHFKYHLLGDRNLAMVKYTKQNGNFTIEIPSCPYLLNSNSLHRINNEDVPAFIEKLILLLREDLNIDISDVEDWRVSQMDIYHDFKLGDELGDYIAALKKVTMSTYDRTETNSQTVAWKNSSREIKFYDKHASSVRKKKSQKEIELSEGVGRFEISAKQAELRKHLGVTTASMGDVFDEAVTTPLLQKYLNIIQPTEMLSTTEQDAYCRLKAKHGSNAAHQLISYIQAVTKGRKSEYPRTTYTRYDRKLKAAGVPPVISEKVLPPLTI